MDYLDSMDPTERLQKAQSAMAEGLIRMIFETSKIQQNEVDQETIRALTSRVDELNDKTAALRAKLMKCRDLSKRIDSAEEWRARLKDILADTCTKLEKATNYATKIATDFADVRRIINTVSTQTQKVSAFVEDLLKRVGSVAEAAQFYRLKSERHARIAKDWLLSEEGSTFTAQLSGEMISNGLQVEAEAYRLVAEEMGLDAAKLSALALTKREQALANLKAIFEKESATLYDKEWDAAEVQEWAKKVDSEFEGRALAVDLDAPALEAPDMPVIPESSVLSTLEYRCMDLSGNLSIERDAIRELSSELGAKEPFIISIDELLRSEPASPQPQPPPDSAN